MKSLYRFWIQLEDGQMLVWRNLSEAQAKQMYTRTLKDLDTLEHGKLRFSWEEVR